MKRITKIEQQKMNSKRFNIYLDDTYYFSVHEDILVSNSLVKGKEIDSERMNKILREEELNKIKQKSLRYISFKSRTNQEVLNYLLRTGFEKEDILQVINQLNKEKWIDDKTFADKFVKQRIKLKPRGKKLLRLELKEKGINEEHIQASLIQIDDSVEFEMASQIVEKKISKYQGEDWTKIKGKLSSYLSRKGFSFSTITAILKHYKTELLLIDE